VCNRQRVTLNTIAVCRDRKAGLTVTIAAVKSSSCLLVSLRDNNVTIIKAGAGNTARCTKLFTVAVEDPGKVVISCNILIGTGIVLTVSVFIRVQFGDIGFTKRNRRTAADKV